MKKVLSMVLAAVIAAGSATAYAVEVEPEGAVAMADGDLQVGDSFIDGDLEYTVLYDGTLKVSCPSDKKATLTQAVIPSEVNGKSVTSIGKVAFEYCSLLTSVTIPDSVTIIGIGAFRDCSSLESVTIPDRVTSIGNSTFYGCSSLTSITIPDSVTSIDGFAFTDCSSLASVTIPDSVTSIGSDAFRDCSSLTSVTIPDSVTSIGDLTFYECGSLEKIGVDSRNENYSSVDGVLFNKDQTALICYPAGKKDTSYEIPNSVTSISSLAFSDCSSLTSVTLPNSVIIKDSPVFDWCSSLEKIEVGTQNENYSSVDGVLFNKIQTELICYPAGKKDTSYEIPDSVTRIGGSAFESCSSLASVTIPDSVTSIGRSAFRSCSSLASVTIPDSVTSIVGYAFDDCSSLESVTISNSVTSIDWFTFEDCSSLKCVTIPDSVTNIGICAFSDCSSLESITIPDSVTNIYSSAFYGCSSLKSVTFNGTMAEWDAIEIDYGNSSLTSAEITCTDGIINQRPSEITIPVEIKIPETGAPDTSDMAVAISGNGVLTNLSIGEDGTVEIGDIADGEYTFTFSAKNCAPRAYDVTVSNGSVSGLEDGVELHLYGDIDGDGKVNMKDVGKANAHAKNTAKLSDYDLSVSDINGDGKINMQDVGLMNAHAKNTKSLW